MKTIGIIGQGFVGTAIRETMRKYFEVWAYDKNRVGEIHHYGGEDMQSVDGDIVWSYIYPATGDKPKLFYEEAEFREITSF